VGFRNGIFGNQNQNPNWKEYTGACLLGPLKANTAYRFKFWIGFTHAQNSPPMDVVFYGTPDCAYLPFGKGNERYGCPMNGPGWVELGRVSVFGVNEWKQYEINVTPKQDIKAIAIGPDCTEITWSAETYYYFDNLILDERINFEYIVSPKNHPCNENHILQVPTITGYTYQWYKEGIALVGETKPELLVKTGEGAYQVRIESSNDCRITTVYHHEIPQDATSFTHKICPGTSYRFKNRNLGRQGVYTETFKSIYNCDSIVTLTLDIEDDLVDSVDARILEGDFVKVGLQQLRAPGRYTVKVASKLGCDSTVYLNLDFLKVYMPTAFSPNDDGINDTFGVFANSPDLQIISIKVFDRWGEQVFVAKNSSNENPVSHWDGNKRGQPAPAGIYVYVVNVLLKGGREQMRYGEVELVR
jgi:gliding motility-associated-like protein